MDHANLLICSASLRTLLFDDNPILLDFVKEHSIDIEVEVLETNLGLFLLSMFVPDDGHISDFLAHILLDEKTR